MAKILSIGAETWTVEKGQQRRGERKGSAALNDTTNISAVNGL